MILRLLAAALALVLAVPAAAHQQKAAVSTVEHNARTGLIEVIHFVPLHDAEHALRVQGQASPDIVADTQSRRAFARYVADRFAMSANGEDLELTLLGSEIDGGNLVIYFEAPSPGPRAVLTIQSQILTDVWRRQINRVNVGSGTSPSTLIFKAGARPQEAALS